MPHFLYLRPDPQGQGSLRLGSFLPDSTLTAVTVRPSDIDESLEVLARAAAKAPTELLDRLIV